MTLNTVSARVSHSGDGATTIFAVPYYFLTDDDLAVYLTVSGVTTDQVLTTDYYVAGAGSEAGGSIVMLVAPPSGSELAIVREPMLVQAADYLANDPFPAETHERALDRGMMVSQFLMDLSNRSLKLGAAYSSTADITPVPDRMLLVNPAGDGIIMGPTGDEIAAAQSYAERAEAAAAGVDAWHANVADMIAATLVDGEIVETRGNEWPGDGGDGTYEVMTPAAYAALTSTPSVPDGTIDHTLANGLVVRLLHGGHIKGEHGGVVLSPLGIAQEKSAEWNAAFAYAAHETYGVSFFSCHTDFLAAEVHEMNNNGSTVDDMKIFLSGGNTYTSGGQLESHTSERPIPMYNVRVRNCHVIWPNIECLHACAGVKLKKDIGSEHYAFDVRGHDVYGIWKVSGNDSIISCPIVKQWSHSGTDIINGKDPTDWDNWTGDGIVITTKDHGIERGQVGWGGPSVRLTDTMPTDPAERIPGRNCYWCGLMDTQGYVDGDNGAGDVIIDNMHMMQGIQDGGALDLATGPRTGAFLDYDVVSGSQIVRTVDSPIGILSFCKTSNLSFFDRVDNDMCVHYLYGAQIEITKETPGSFTDPQTSSSSPNFILDPFIRIFASVGSSGNQRYPLMASMRHERGMTAAFIDDNISHQTLFIAGGLDENHSFVANHQTGIQGAQGSSKNIRYISSAGLTDVGDDVHFDGVGLFDLGGRYADMAVPLLNLRPSTAPVVIGLMGASNSVGQVGATNGDHTIEPGVYVYNGSILDGPGTAFIPAEYGVAPFDRGSNPWANNLSISLANRIKTETGRDVYIIVQGKGSRNAESFIPPAVNLANGWTADEDLADGVYAEMNAALALVPGRTTVAPDVICWQGGEANNADTAGVFEDKILEVIDGLSENGLYANRVSWNGNHTTWNTLNRASGPYGGDTEWRGTLAAGTHSPVVSGAGDFWIAQGAVTVNPGSVAATNGQIVMALVEIPTIAGDWWVGDEDSAPIRGSFRHEINILPNMYNYWPANDVSGVANVTNETSADMFTERLNVDGASLEFELDGGTGEYKISVPQVRITAGSTDPSKLYMGPGDNGMEVESANVSLHAGGARQWSVNGTGRMYPEADGTQHIGTSALQVGTVFATEVSLSAGAVTVTGGAGSPEGVITAGVGSLYTRTDGGAGTTMYVKESGASNTGWIAK